MRVDPRITELDRQDQLDCALGFMVGRAAMAEFFLHQAIRKVIGSPYASLVTASLPVSAALDVIGRLVEAGKYGPEASQEIKEFVDKSRPLFAERNRYVHGLRVIGSEQDQIFVSNRRKGSMDQYIAAVDALRQLGEEFSRVAGKIFDWTMHYVEGRPRPRMSGIDSLNQSSPGPEQPGESF
jgi:hypothetical protein